MNKIRLATIAGVTNPRCANSHIGQGQLGIATNRHYEFRLQVRDEPP